MQYLDKKCKFVGIFVTKIGHSGHLNSTYSRTFKIGKGWIASSIRPRNDIKPFRPNVLLKGNNFTTFLLKINFANKKATAETVAIIVF